MKHSTTEYEDAFKTLSSKGLGKVNRKVAKNNIAYLTFTKISYSELATSIDVMDKWPGNVSLKDYDKVYEASRKRDEVSIAAQDLELSDDRIEEVED